MPISNLLHNETNFADIRDRGETMNAIDFDDAFTQIVNFINNNIITELNQLLGGAVPGSTNPNDINKFRRNIGDGTTEWAFIGNDAFEDFTLEFSKLSRCTPCTVLATGADRIFKEVTTDQSNFTLISQANNLPVWRKLRSENIIDRAITGAKIALGTLTNENLQNDLLATQLLDNAVTGVKIVDRTIPTGKIENGAINEDILRDLLSPLIGRNFAGGFQTTIQLYGNTLPDGFITNLNYFTGASNSLIRYYHLRGDFKIPLNVPITWSAYNVADGAIAGYQIANRSLSGLRLNQPTNNSGGTVLVRDINDLIADAGIAPANLPANYRVALGL